MLQVIGLVLLAVGIATAIVAGVIGLFWLGAFAWGASWNEVTPWHVFVALLLSWLFAGGAKVK